MQNGANVNNLTKDGFCFLRIAAQENHVAIAESLIRHGADQSGEFRAISRNAIRADFDRFWAQYSTVKSSNWGFN